MQLQSEDLATVGISAPGKIIMQQQQQQQQQRNSRFSLPPQRASEKEMPIYANLVICHTLIGQISDISDVVIVQTTIYSKTKQSFNMKSCLKEIMHVSRDIAVSSSATHPSSQRTKVEIPQKVELK